jgi:hypothetical protein
MALVVSPKESETKIVNDFLNALNKVGVKRIRFEKGYLIINY